MKVGITGSRIGVSENMVRSAFHELKKEGLDIECFIFGGAVGADTVALKAAARVLPDIPRFVIVPGKVEQQPVTAQVAIEVYADQVEEMEHPKFPRAPAYYARNQRIVDESDMLLVFYGYNPGDHPMYHGGTGDTAKRADKKKIEKREYYS